MKKKFYFFAVSAAMLLTACSSEEVTNGVTDTSQAKPLAVGFDIYASSATRAGQTGIMTTTDLQTTGFGVFATQQTDGSSYSAYKNETNIIPNFMYNQKVTYAASSWGYSPLKYWPNETQKDSQGAPSATSTDIDKLSFFAYAPYVSSGSGTVGIKNMSANNTTADPVITYVIATKPSNSVDLLWGVAPTSGLSYQSVNPDKTVTIQQYKPLIDLIKPSKDQKIKFLFNHALARLGLTVVAAADQIAPGGKLDEQTKIYIKEIKLFSSSIKKSGDLNLNSTQWVPVGATVNTATAGQAKWENATGDMSLTIDKDNELASELQCKFNGDGAVNYSDTWTNKIGVKTKEENVIAKKDGKDQYFMVIPQHTDTGIKVDITYYVITKDTSLSEDYAVTENKITKIITIPGFTNNKAYNLKLILGMTSVKLDAEVADWQVDGSTDVNLPRNNE